MREVVVWDEALQNGNHIAKIKRVDHASDRYLMFFECDLYGRKIKILNNTGPTSIHLLHEFPYAVINYEIILFFLDVWSEVVAVVEQLRIIDASQISLINIFQICSVQLRPLLFDKIDGWAFHSW